MDVSLGRFGDRRLEKGGPIFWPVLSRAGGARFGFGGLAGTGREKFS